MFKKVGFISRLLPCFLTHLFEFSTKVLGECFRITCLKIRPRSLRDHTISSENTRYVRAYPDGCSEVLGEDSEREHQLRAHWKENERRDDFFGTSWGKECLTDNSVAACSTAGLANPRLT